MKELIVAAGFAILLFTVWCFAIVIIKKIVTNSDIKKYRSARQDSVNEAVILQSLWLGGEITAKEYRESLELIAKDYRELTESIRELE